MSAKRGIALFSRHNDVLQFLYACNLIICMQLFFFALFSINLWLWKRKELHFLHMTPVNVSTVTITNKLNEYIFCGHFKTNSK